MPTDPEARTPDRLRRLTRVMGLAIACPFSQDNPVRCQLCDVRSLPMSERIEWVRGLSAGDMQRISADHEACLKALERQPPGVDDDGEEDAS